MHWRAQHKPPTADQQRLITAAGQLLLAALTGDAPDIDAMLASLRRRES